MLSDLERCWCAMIIEKAANALRNIYPLIGACIFGSSQARAAA